MQPANTAANTHHPRPTTHYARRWAAKQKVRDDARRRAGRVEVLDGDGHAQGLG